MSLKKLVGGFVLIGVLLFHVQRVPAYIIVPVAQDQIVLPGSGNTPYSPLDSFNILGLINGTGQGASDILSFPMMIVPQSGTNNDSGSGAQEDQGTDGSSNGGLEEDDALVAGFQDTVPAPVELKSPNPAPVPVPGSVWLLGSGVGLCWIIRRFYNRICGV